MESIVVEGVVCDIGGEYDVRPDGYTGAASDPDALTDILFDLEGKRVRVTIEPLPDIKLDG